MSDIGVKESIESVESASACASVEVACVAQRRRFTAEFKRRILDEADRAGPGEIGLILRREGLYSSQLSKWRQWRSGMSTPQKNNGKDVIDLAAYRQLEKENARLKLKLRKAEAMLDLQKKAAEILSYDNESERSDS